MVRGSSHLYGIGQRRFREAGKATFQNESKTEEHMNQYVAVGIFDDIQGVKRAVEHLRQMLFMNIGIAVLDPGLSRQVEPGLLVDVNKDDLIANGLSAANAAYCENEVKNGQILLVVKALVGIDGANSHIRGSGGRPLPPSEGDTQR
jgi:hypothetical protein